MPTSDKLIIPIFKLVLLTICFSTACVAPRLHLTKKSLTGYFENDPLFRESHTGLVVYDPSRQKIVFDYHGHQHFIPASNTKLITYLSGLTLLGDSLPALSYHVNEDTLYFSGTGDPTLLYPNFGYGKTRLFLQNFPGELRYSARPWLGGRLGPGWAWDDYPYYYSAERSSFPIYGNMAFFYRDSISKLPRVHPPYFGQYTSVSTDPNALSRDEFSNHFQLVLPDDTTAVDEAVPFIYSDSLFVTLLSDTLHRPVTMGCAVPDSTWQTLYAVAVDSLYKHMLLSSDNFLAEQLLLMASAGLGDTLSPKNAIKSMMEGPLGALHNDLHWVDGSGLSRYNMVTPHAMITILQMIALRVEKDKLYMLLPSAGTSGTIQSSYLTLKGMMHAKTGSMTHVYNLSGFLETKSGKTLIFSFMNNNFNTSFSELKIKMEYILKTFSDNYK